jgi:ABC-type phosphate transport system substrate-binding protein
MLQGCDMFAIRRAWRGPRFSAVNTYRNAAMALVTCAASLSLAACTAGITTTSTATAAATSSSSPSPSRSATMTSSPAPAGRMLAVSGKISTFPVPAGAKVAENVSLNNDISIGFGKVTLAKVQSFYAQALPKAGYTITSNSSASESGGVVLIQFTGHGYKGQVSALASDPDPSDTLPGLGSKNVTTILLQPK